MSATTRNSMAAALSGVTGVVMWLAGIFGIIGALVLSAGLAASLSGGEASVSGMRALAEGVSPSTFILALCTLVIVVPGLIYICIQLRRILSTLAAGDPFVPENASRLSRVALVIAIMELLRYATVLIIWMFPALMSGAEPKLSVNLILWASVAALAVLSHVFREGTRLREQEKMTI